MEDIKINTKIKLSALWVSVMFLYIYADILSLFKPGEVQEILEGRMGPFPATQGALLTASILMIIPALMVFLSLALNVRANRNVNIFFGALYTLVNISNLIGETWIYYLVFGVVEIVMTLLIIWHAWKWPNKHAV
jgi:hypothetical protein